jgi:glyoxylase-like metal-dependent hydrolase (beta-lactamase superfamily II)
MADATMQVAAAIAAGLAPQVISLFDEVTFTATHLVFDPETRHAAIIDSVLDFDPASGRTSHGSADKLVALVAEHGLHVDWILETHAHADHLSAAPWLQERLGGKIAIGKDIRHVQQVFGGIFNQAPDLASDGSQFDHLFTDGERFRIGNFDAIAVHVPGHTPADMAYIVGDAAFIGDTLFMPDYGTARADFPGGDARTLFRSIRRLLTLPAATRVFLCHDYKAPGRDSFAYETTIGAERSSNVHVHEGVAEDDFVAMREARDKSLGMPRLILPSIQVNIRAGHLPQAESNGTRYLKLPLNIL